MFEFGLDHDNAEIQSLTTQALCKLMLFNRFNNDEVCITTIETVQALKTNLFTVIATPFDGFALLFSKNNP